MALLKMEEIRSMTVEERDRKLDELRAELSKQRAAMLSGAGMENPGVIRGIRKNIARILTVNNEKARRAAAESVGGGE
ncbi:MAG: 50S ribosomal protein L29 [Promethearchaeota archaeon]